MEPQLVASYKPLDLNVAPVSLHSTRIVNGTNSRYLATHTAQPGAENVWVSNMHCVGFNSS